MDLVLAHAHALTDEAAASYCLVTVIRTSGSTPRHVGTTMLVGPGATLIGTIGGGRVEQEVTAAAESALSSGTPLLITHHLVRDLAMCCGGSMTFIVEPLADCHQILSEAARRLADRQGIDIRFPIAGGTKHIAPPTARAPYIDGDEFVQPYRPSPRVILFGHGHLARATGPLLNLLGFSVTVCDDGDTDALALPPPWADHAIDSFDPRDVEHAIGALGAGDYAVIFTRDHAIDQQILERLLPNDNLTYLGLIGSRGKVERFRKRLTAKGIATDARWQRLDAPMGIDIGAETPQEIAVSIAAQLVSRRGQQ